jgi:hypothetical protein
MHRVFFGLWLILALVCLIALAVEIYSGVFFSILAHTIAEYMAGQSGFLHDRVYMVVRSQIQPFGYVVVSALSVLSVLFLICAYYCRRLVTRSRYILALEAAVDKDKNSTLLLRDDKSDTATPPVAGSSDIPVA